MAGAGARNESGITTTTKTTTGGVGAKAAGAKHMHVMFLKLCE